MKIRFDYKVVILALVVAGSLIFDRDPAPSEQVIEEVRSASESKGFDRDGTWVSVASNQSFVSFVDLGSVRYMNDSSIRAKTAYVLNPGIDIDNHIVNIALKTGIYNCEQQTEVIASIEYFSTQSDSFKKHVAGSTKLIKIPQGTYASEELEKICKLQSKKLQI